MFSRLLGKSAKPRHADGVYFDGAYRLHRPTDIERFTALARTAFPEYSDRIECFGADWLGRQFAKDLGRMQGGEPLVLMLEPGTGEALEIPVSYVAFHEHELIEQSDAVAATSFFEQWRSAGGAIPSYDECIGYKVPLYLGGPDDITNLEKTDVVVYWAIAAQLLAKTRGLVIGTQVNRITIGD